jgi:hypothetical protein
MAGMPSPSQQQAMQQALQEQAMMTVPEQQGNLMQGVAQQNADLVKWQLDQEDVLTKIENLLRGNVWSGKGWEKKGKQLMNDIGIRVFLTQLSGFCHKGIITSIYSKEEIDARMKVVHRTVVDLIFLNWENFGIDQNDAKLIWDIIVLGQIEPMYRRATNGKYLQFLGTTQKRIESFSQAQNPQRSSGLFGWMKGSGQR